MLVNIRSDLRRESAACPCRRPTTPPTRQPPTAATRSPGKWSGRHAGDHRPRQGRGDAYPGSHLGPLVTDGRPEGRPECAQVMTVRRTGSSSTCAAAGTRRIRAARPRPRPARMPQPHIRSRGAAFTHPPGDSSAQACIQAGHQPPPVRNDIVFQPVTDCAGLWTFLSSARRPRGTRFPYRLQYRDGHRALAGNPRAYEVACCSGGDAGGSADAVPGPCSAGGAADAGSCAFIRASSPSTSWPAVRASS